MRFEIGKYYQHAGGRVFHVVCRIHTFFHGECLLAEESTGALVPAGEDEGAAINWHQVSGWPRDVYDENRIPEPRRMTCRKNCTENC